MKLVKSQKLTLKPIFEKIKQDIKIIVINAERISVEVVRLQTVYNFINRTANSYKIIDVARQIAVNARFRLKSINRLVNLNGYNHRINLIMKTFVSFESNQQQFAKMVAEAKRVHSLVTHKVIIIKHGMIHNQLALSKMNHLQRIANLPKHDVGCIEVFYVDAHNKVVKRQTELDRIGKSFNLTTHLTALPYHYHFVRIVVGKHHLLYHTNVQQVMIEIAKDSVVARLMPRQKPLVERDVQQLCQVRIVYLDPNGKVIQIHSSLGRKGDPFVLKQAIHLPADYTLVKVISGLNIKHYLQHEQLIELEIKPNESKPRQRINSAQVRQGFWDYYNARIMDITPHSSDYSTRLGYACAKQYLRGVADAYQGLASRMDTRLYQHGYRSYCRKIAEKRIKTNSFSDVLLKLY